MQRRIKMYLTYFYTMGTVSNNFLTNIIVSRYCKNTVASQINEWVKCKCNCLLLFPTVEYRGQTTNLVKIRSYELPTLQHITAVTIDKDGKVVPQDPKTISSKKQVEHVINEFLKRHVNKWYNRVYICMYK